MLALQQEILRLDLEADRSTWAEDIVEDKSLAEVDKHKAGKVEHGSQSRTSEVEGFLQTLGWDVMGVVNEDIAMAAVEMVERPLAKELVDEMAVVAALAD